MPKIGIAAVLFAGSLLATAGPAHSQAIDNSGKYNFNGPTVYASVGGVVFERSRPSGGIIVGNNPFTGTSFLSASQYNFPKELGIDGTVGVRFLGSEAIEARFVNFESRTSLSFRTPGGFIGTGFTGPANTLFDTRYDTRLMSWEVNWRHQFFDHLSVLAGVRQITLTDDLVSQLNTTVANGTYNYTNRMVGVQVGAEWAVLPKSSPFQINVIGKVGRFDLRSFGAIREFQGASQTFIGSFGTSINDHIYASEAGVSVGYRIVDNVVIRAGYQALWLNNVGLASNNAASSLLNPSLLNTNVYRDRLVLQGINFGLSIGM